MVQAASRRYAGAELDLFALATNWKNYVRQLIGDYLIGDVLEVGAGIGGTTTALNAGSARRWVCLEPDTDQALRLASLSPSRWPGQPPLVIAGSLDAIAPRPRFDCILYMDVLEHISEDRQELETAAKLLRKNGHLVVLSPAHQWLYSEFDRNIGHLRRYDKKTLRDLKPRDCSEKKLAYLDAVGLFLSLSNAIALKQRLPSEWQIRAWDRYCIPMSRIADRIFLEKIGKSILGVWEKCA
jgi:hypothetical protein